ncbi:MAG TPA: hypothetical protein VMG32_14355 [Anaeromyxobacteraceae bacterium]|nr:hypothetical protein [Anaeromyxobacteraceae bacterium]
MRKRALLAAALLACAGPRPRPPHGEVVLTVDGAVEEGPYRFGQDDLPNLPRRSFRARSPFTGAEERFEGLAVVPFLADHVSLDHGADLAVFHGQGGLVAAVSLAVLRQTKPVLAYRFADREEGATPPLELAWPNLDEPGIEGDPRMAGWWLKGVDRIEMRSWSASYGRALRVPFGAGEDARLGADALGTLCLGCHRLRGAGGTRGPELRDLDIAADREGFLARMREHAASLVRAHALAPTDLRTLGEIADFLSAVERSSGDAGEGPATEAAHLLPEP